MTLIDPNGLKGSYQGYQARQVKTLCSQIPEVRRKKLLEEIEARAFLFGYSNQSAFNSATKHLRPIKPQATR